MTDQIIPGNRYSKAFSPRRNHHITPHLTDLFSHKTGTHATLALTQQQQYPSNGRNRQKIYATASGHFLPSFSFERKKTHIGCTEWQRCNGTAHQLTSLCITLKYVQP